MRGTRKQSTRILSFVLSLIMVASTFMTDYTIARASEAVEETVTSESETESSESVSETSEESSDVEETSEAEESEESEATEETDTTDSEEVVDEDAEATDDEEVADEDTETTEEVVEELLDEEELLEEELIGIVEEMIKISFKASEGGSVSMSEQELGEEDEVEAVTATADEGYEFVNWTKGGEEVSSSEKFTPAKEEATYVANFEEVEEELEFNQSMQYDGMKISLYAKPGVLPNDAILRVEEVSSKLEKEIKETINEETEETVEETYSYDINIYSESKGGYVQPEDGTVSVTFELLDVDTEDKTVSVYHVKENGNSVSGVEEVVNAGKNADTVAFEAEHFSVYTVVLKLNGYEKSVYVECVDENHKSIGKNSTVKINDDEVAVADLVDDFKIAGYRFKAAYIVDSYDRHSTVEIEKIRYKNYSIQYKGKDGEWYTENYGSTPEVCFHYEKDGTVQVCVYVMDDGWAGNEAKEAQLGLTKKDSNGFYPVGVVNIPSTFVSGNNPYLNNVQTWNALKPYLNSMDTSKSVFSNNGGFKEANGDNHMVDYLDNVNTSSGFGDAGSGLTALFNWGSSSYGFDHDVKYHLDLRMEVRTVTFKNGNNGIAGLENGKTEFGTRGYFENEAIENPDDSTYDFYLKGIPTGYAVVGYYKDANCTQAYTFGNPITKNEVVYVKLAKENYTVTWKDGNSTLKTDGNVAYGTTTLNLAPIVADKTVSGKVYTFEGWSVENDGTVDNIPTAVTANATYYAVFKEVPVVAISGTKTWDDENDVAGFRPTSITVNLLANGVKVDSTTVTAKNGWRYNFGERVTYKDGENITYSVTENPVAEYSVTYNGFNITNKHIPQTMDISGTKIWDDADNQDGVRPASITVNLLANGTKVDSTTVTAEAGWKYSFTELLKYKNGSEIVYTVTEDTVAGYTAVIDGFDITNIHEVEKVDISGTKTWDDADNQDGVRPTSITVNLLADGKEVAEVKVAARNGWKYSFNGFPKCENGEEIVYTVTEDTVNGYTTTIKDFNITNTHKVEMVDIKIEKVWNDADDQDGMRPASITVNLFADGTKVDSATITATDNWKHTFTVDKNRAGKAIAYTFAEEKVDGYSTVYSVKNGVNVITNSYTPAIVDISGTKTWDDNDNQDGVRPESITVNLSANGTKVDSATVTETDGWKYSFTELPEYADGVKIVYTVTEDEVENYSTTISGYSITNSYTPQTTTVNGVKTWDDNDNQDGVRPVNITVNLLANGTEIEEKVVTASQGWQYSFDNLPKFANGEEIVYTVTEDAVEGYTTAVDGYNIKNTHVIEKTSVSVTKAWVDNDNQDGVRPASITVYLLANDTVVDSATVTADDNWAYEFTNLDKYAAGEEIEYTVEEEAVEGYETSVEGFNITNTHEVEKVDISGTKTWVDNDDQDGVRPESITVNLLADGAVVDSSTVTEADDWTYEFVGLDKYAAGEEIEYTVEEEAVEGYESSVEGFNITNIHELAKVNVSGIKVWDDADNQDGVRPESIIVNLLANGEMVRSMTVTADTDWTYEFKDLDKCEAGEEIVYTLSEEEVDGYTTTIEVIDGVNTITNTYTPATISVVGTKTWDDADDRDRIRPIDITLTLLADGTPIETENGELIATTSATEEWKYFFTNLPKYRDAGTEIVYTIEELAIAGYTTTYSEAVVEEGVITLDLTNTHTPTPPSGGGGGGTSGGGGGRSDSDVGRVLGARREDIATAGEEGQVLGAVRAPKTSDSSRAILWMLVMGTSALGAAAILAQKKNEEEN